MPEQSVEIRFREFRRDDMDALYFLTRRGSPAGRSLSYGRLLNLLLERDVAAVVAEAHVEGWSRVIGAMVVRGEAWRAQLHIVILVVEREFRTRGIARRLLAWAHRLAHGTDCRELALPLPAGRADAGAFLRRVGFVPHEGDNPYFAAPEEGTLWLCPLGDAEAAGQEGP